MFGWHKHYLPVLLLDLAWVYFRGNSRILGVKMHQSKRGMFSDEHVNSAEYIEVRRKNGLMNGPKNGLVTKERKVGIFSQSARQKNVEVTKRVKSKKVKVTYPDGHFEFYYSAQETSRRLGISQHAVSLSARLSRRVTKGSFKGYLFEYA
jgi:hypothetical protein